MVKKHKKAKAKRSRKKPSSVWATALRDRLIRFAPRGAVGGLIIGLAVVAAMGVSRLNAHVQRELSDQVPPVILFKGLPPTLTDKIRNDLYDALGDLLDRPWTDDHLCRDIAGRLAGVGWVSRINYVRRQNHGQFDVNCRYRVPAALVQSGTTFYLVDREGVRLPGTYELDSSRPLIQGVRRKVPPPGQPWVGEDLRAGLDILARIQDQPFSHQIRTCLVGNLKGRLEPHGCHMQLATERAGGRICWGSAPGLEVEENSVEQKLAILNANFERTGRADANHLVIDISTFPDRFQTPFYDTTESN